MNALGLGGMYNNIAATFQNNNNNNTYSYTDSDDDCGLCLDSLVNSDDAVIHKGDNGNKHAYHSLCLKTWYARQHVYNLPTNCPSCKEHVNHGSLYKLVPRIRNQEYNITLQGFAKCIQAGAAGLSMYTTAFMFEMINHWDQNKEEAFSPGVIPLVIGVTAGYLGSQSNLKQYSVVMAVKYVSLIALGVYATPNKPEYWFSFASFPSIADIAGGCLGYLAASGAAATFKAQNNMQVLSKINEHHKIVINAYNQAQESLQEDIRNGRIRNN
jgi:hypothetical protein